MLRLKELCVWQLVVGCWLQAVDQKEFQIWVGVALCKIEKLMCYKTHGAQGKEKYKAIIHFFYVVLTTMTYKKLFSFMPQISHLSNGANICINHVKIASFVGQTLSKSSNFIWLILITSIPMGLLDRFNKLM